MTWLFIDDSVQRTAGFILCAVVASRTDPTAKIGEALAVAGLDTAKHEFKSGSRMSADPRLRAAREGLYRILAECNIGIVVTSLEFRGRLGDDVLRGVEKIIRANELDAEQTRLYVDNGIRCSREAREVFSAGPARACELNFGSDSRTVLGIQLADLAAHGLGTMLIEEMGLVKKLVKAGPNSGYDPDLKVELGFELWARMRWNFFKAPQPFPGADSQDPVGTMEFDVENYGLYVSPRCPQELLRAAISRFGRCYLGCIH
jgi:hypothetical protein